MIPVQSQCTACTHLDREPDAAQPQQQCEAFPEDIPQEIWTNEVAHTRPYPGDHGVHLDLIPLEQYRPQNGQA